MGDQVAAAAKSSARVQARIAGVLYLGAIATGMFALFALDSIVVRDAAATARNILASEEIFRVAFSARVVGLPMYLAVVAILYVLLKPAGRTLSLVAAFFGLTGCAIHGASLISNFAPLFLLGDAAYLRAFEAEQLQALARVSLRSYSLGFYVGLVFFGFYCLSIGWLIVRSRFLPRIIGVLVVIAGACYLVDQFAYFLFPQFSSLLNPWVLIPLLAGEVSLALWLATMGVDEEKRRLQALAAAPA